MARLGETLSIFASADSVTEQTADMGTTAFTTKAVYGNASSLMIGLFRDVRGSWCVWVEL